MSEVNISNALAEFVGAFEVVFRYDWEYTKIMIGDEATGATFLEPGLDDESDVSSGCKLIHAAIEN